MWTLCRSPRWATVLPRLTESQIWHQPTVGGRAQQRDNGLCSPNARHLRLSLCATGALRSATPVLELRGSEPGWVSPCVDSLRGNCLGIQQFFSLTQSHSFLQPEIVGTYLLSTGTLDWGGHWHGAGTSHAQDIPLEFLSTTRGWVRDQPIPHLRPSY